MTAAQSAKGSKKKSKNSKNNDGKNRSVEEELSAFVVAEESIDQQIINLTSNDDRVALLRRENQKLQKKLRSRDTGWDIIRHTLEEVYSEPSLLKVSPPKKPKRRNLLASKHTEVAVLHLTDIHYGKVTPTYNTSVCEERLLLLCEAVEEIVALRRTTATIDRLKLLLGGDMIEGQNIFPGQAMETEVDIVKQMIKEGPEIIANVILRMLQLFPRVEVEAVPGNHGRLDRHGAKSLNADSVFYEIVRTLVGKAAKDESERISWNLPFDREDGRQWYARFKIIGDHEGMLVHGDQVRGQLGYPWYGWGKKVAGWGLNPETCGFQFVFGGHYHTQGSFPINNVRVMATASTESTNQYALENFSSAGPPEQRLNFFNRRYGLLAEYPVHLSNPPKVPEDDEE